jgi:hypothetical protein
MSSLDLTLDSSLLRGMLISYWALILDSINYNGLIKEQREEPTKEQRDEPTKEQRDEPTKRRSQKVIDDMTLL